MGSFLPGDDETHRGGEAAADVQRGERAGVPDLGLAGLPGHLAGRVVQHPDAGGADRVPDADQAAARVDRDRAVAFELAVLDRLPALAGFGDAEVVDGHVLRHGEAVVRLDAVEHADVRYLGAPEGVGDDAPDMREDVPLALAAVQLRLERQPGGAMSPAGDPGPGVRARPARAEPVGNQQQAGHAVGDLGAVGAAQPPLDDGVVVVILGEAARAELPFAGLGKRVVFRIAHVELGDGVQVLVFQAVAAVVLVGQLAEHVRPHERGVLALVPDPGGRAEVLGRVFAGYIALLLDREYEDAVVAAGLDLGRGRQYGDAAGGAGGFVPRGRLAPQPRLDRGRHRAELPLPGEELAERVPDVDRFHVFRSYPGIFQRARHGLGHHVGDLQALARVVPREVTLVAARDPRVRAAHV